MKNFNLKGVASELQFGKRGPKLSKDVDEKFHIKDALGAYTNMKGASPVDAEDFVTLGYLRNNAIQAVVKGTINSAGDTASGQALPHGYIAVVSASGLTAPYDTVGELFRWDTTLDSWAPVAMQEGFVVTVNNTLTGANLTLEEGFVYVWEGGQWLNNGDTPVEADVYKAHAEEQTNLTGSELSTYQIPAGALIDEIIVDVFTAFDDPAADLTATLNVDATPVIDASDCDLSVVGRYKIEKLIDSNSLQAINFAISGASTVGGYAVVVKYKRA